MNEQLFIRDYERTLTAKGRRILGSFSIEGYRLMERALESGVKIRDILLSESFVKSPNRREKYILQELEKRNLPFHIAPDAILKELTQGRTFGPILALIEALPAANLEKILLEKREHLKLLVLVDVMDAGNIGALMRTALASGVDAMLVLRGTDPYHPKAARTSMGAIFDLPVLSSKDPLAIQTLLRENHIQQVGAVVRAGQPPYKGQLLPRHALFVGSEAHGLPEDIQKNLDLFWTIPMMAELDSFSINAATAILLYEMNRRQWTN